MSLSANLAQHRLHVLVPKQTAFFLQYLIGSNLLDFSLRQFWCYSSRILLLWSIWLCSHRLCGCGDFVCSVFCCFFDSCQIVPCCNFDLSCIVSSFNFEFGSIVPDISADQRRSVRGLNDNHPFSRRDTAVQPFRLGFVVYGNNACDCTMCYPSRPLLQANSVSAPVTVTSYIAKFQSLPDARRFVSVRQDGGRLDVFGSKLQFEARYRCW